MTREMKVRVTKWPRNERQEEDELLFRTSLMVIDIVLIGWSGSGKQTHREIHESFLFFPPSTLSGGHAAFHQHPQHFFLSFLYSCSVYYWKLTSHRHGGDKVVEDEAARAAVRQPGGYRPGGVGHHVPAGRGVRLEPPLDRRRRHLQDVRPGGLLLWGGQHHEPDPAGCRALHRLPQSQISK